MRRILFLSLAWISLALALAGQTQPDFSGTWKMDPSRSESAHQGVPIGSVGLVIRQTADVFSVKTRRAGTKGSASSDETLVFQLDGTEATNVGASGVPIKVKAHWAGSKLVAETSREMNSATVTTTQVFELAASGGEIRIQKTLSVQHGYQGVGTERSSTGSGTDVFVKVTSKRE